MPVKFYKPKFDILPVFIFLILVTSCKKNFSEISTSVQNAGDARAGSATRPNIILIIGDDIGYEIPQYTGGQSYSTPNLNFMAANGMQFTNFFSHPDGPPSRLAMVTGKYNYRNWVKFGLLADTSKTIANMLEDAGYQTCYVGKWQFDGGDTSIRQHGFQYYRVFQPYNIKDNNGLDQYHRRYKNPYLFESGAYLPDNMVKGRYSEDMFYEYAGKFIDKANRKKPFFIMYSHNLVQHPWVPTPDDPDFANWNPAVDDSLHENAKYFPGMVSYMDKIIGKLISKIDSSSLGNNTIIIFTSDNATNKQVQSLFKGVVIKGGKTHTDRWGINVPLVVYGKTNVLPAAIDTSLVDMTDFLPTLANISRTPLPTTWGLLDGTTFSDNLFGVKGKQRSFVYCYWPKDYYLLPYPDVSFAFDYKYKLYDQNSGNRFYHISIDTDETNPLSDAELTSFQVREKFKLQNILASYAGVDPQ